MIVSRASGFVFIKTRKTAGSSLEIALSRFCRDGDIVTRLGDGEEAVRQAEGGFGPARHDKPLRAYSPREFWKWLRHRRHATWFKNHAGIDAARARVDVATWQRLFKFTAERNPWDKAVSRYYWQQRRRARRHPRESFPAFADYLEYLEEQRPHWLSDWALYTDGGTVAVDDFIFYEDLSGGLARVSERLGLAESIRLPDYRAKARGNVSSGDYRDEYDSRAQEIVQRVCRREIEAFGYSFDDPGRPPPRDACTRIAAAEGPGGGI